MNRWEEGVLLRGLTGGLGVCTPQFLVMLGDVERDRVQMLRGGDELSSCKTNRMRKVR
jgi:hypothetical protein